MDLVVTSPPYGANREYHGFIFDFKAIAAQLWRVTRPGGVVVWVAGDTVVDGGETLESLRQALHFQELGFLCHDTMIYQKDGAPFPDVSRYYQLFEYMFVLSKGRPATRNLIRTKTIYGPRANPGTRRQADGTLRRIKYQTGRETKVLGNIWRYATGYQKDTRDDIALGHPARFPEKLARDHIISWSNLGDLVLDPMVGSGTTGKQAIVLDRRFIGIDISARYLEITHHRIERAARERAGEFHPIEAGGAIDDLPLFQNRGEGA